MALDQTDNFMEPPVPDSDDTVDKLVLTLLPDDAPPVLIVTLPLTPLVTALTSFNIIATYLLSVPIPDDILWPTPKPVVPVPPLTDTTPPVVEPAPDANDRSPPLPPDDDPDVKEASPPVAAPVDPAVRLIAPPLPPDGDVVDPALTVTAPPTPLSPDPTDTVMEPPVPDTADPDDKLMLPLLPDDASPVLIVTLPLTPLVPSLTFFSSIAPDLVMPLPKLVLSCSLTHQHRHSSFGSCSRIQ